MKKSRCRKFMRVFENPLGINVFINVILIWALIECHLDLGVDRYWCLQFCDFDYVHHKYLEPRANPLIEREKRNGPNKVPMNCAGAAWVPFFLGSLCLQVLFQMINDLAYDVV